MNNNKDTKSLNKCPCKKANKGKGKNFFIACDCCQQWWHGQCVNLTREICEIFRVKKLSFKCPFCITRELNSLDDHPVVAENTEVKKQLTDCQAEKSRSSDERSRKDRLTVLQEKYQKKLEEEKETNVKDTESKHIVIVDGLKSPKNFKDSQVLKKEIYKHKKDIHLKYTYPLARGGIAIHVENEKEIEELQKEWPAEAFGDSGKHLSVHKIGPGPRCVFKNLQSSLGEEFVKEEIKKQCGVDVSIRRLRYRDSKKPLPVAVVTCAAHEGLAALFKADITIAKKKVRVVPYRSKRNIPVRCYRCQEYGHIANSCENEERCEKCSESHKGGCKGKIKCYNCKGSHGAGVRDCPVYVNLFVRLTSRQ